MIPDAAPQRLALPVLAPPPPRSGFPVVATAAPVLVSVGIWAVTGSPYSLLFAALGPVVALGSVLDGRRQRRQTVRRQTERTVAALVRARDRVLELQESERARLRRMAPPIDERLEPGGVAGSWARALDLSGPDVAPLPVRLGRAEHPPVVVVDGGAGELEPDSDLPSAVRTALAEVRAAAAAFPDAPWLADARDGIGIVAPAPLGRALARSVALQLAAARSPLTARLSAPSEELWALGLPHAVDFGVATEYRLIEEGAEVRVAWAADAAALPAGVPVTSVPPAAYLEPLGAARAEDGARRLAAVAEERGLRPVASRLPQAVRLADVLEAGVLEADVLEVGESAAGVPAGSEAGLRAPVGRGADGIVELDLVRDGPHAVVAGTTGAGKSELLVSWVLAMASRHPPSAVTFLLVDFKGGAAFAPLAGLPHVLGTVSDLDARRSARAIESLRAELLRRERVLAERGARSIDELGTGAAPGMGPPLARLVIVVDEFAAVVSGQPELHELFADLAARGRSLGLHLILCTQRPSGVVRDSVLANITLRISLRVIDRGDSIAMLGSDAAARLAPDPRGRALIADGVGGLREVQWALAEPADAMRPAGSGAPPAGAVWCEPLPEQLPLGPLLAAGGAEAGDGLPIGRLDLPSEQRQPIARYDLRTDGHLLVLGGARSGRTAALATIAEAARAAGVPVTVVPGDPAEAWSRLAELVERPAPSRPAPSRPTPSRPAESHLAASLTTGALVILDDLDLLLERVDPDSRHEVLELLTRVGRVIRGGGGGSAGRGGGLVVTAMRLAGGLAGFAGLFDSRLLLRQSSREEHVLAGGNGAAFDPRLPPGSGRWTGGSSGGAVIQLALGGDPLPTAELVELPAIGAEPGRALAVATPRPRALARRWTAAGARVVLLGEQAVPDEEELRVSRGGAPIVLIGDPDAWQAEWALLGLARRELPLAIVGCTASEVRALTRIRDAAPLLGSRAGECWLVEAGVVRRAVLRLPSEPDEA